MCILVIIYTIYSVYISQTKWQLMIDLFLECMVIEILLIHIFRIMSVLSDCY